MIVKSKKQTEQGSTLMEWQLSGYTQPQQTARGRVHTTKTGLASGTLILTADGELPAEYLNPGDRIVSRNQGMAVVKDVRSALVKTRVAAIEPGALGHGSPGTSALLPVGQTVLVRDDRARPNGGQTASVVTISELIDGHSIRDLGRRVMILISLDFEEPQIIYADGIEVAIPHYRAEFRGAR